MADYSARDLALWDALSYDRENAVLAALQAGANPNRPDPSGRYPLDYACVYGSLATIQALMEAGAVPAPPGPRRAGFALLLDREPEVALVPARHLWALSRAAGHDAEGMFRQLLQSPLGPALLWQECGVRVSRMESASPELQQALLLSIDAPLARACRQPRRI